MLTDWTRPYRLVSQERRVCPIDLCVWWGFHMRGVLRITLGLSRGLSFYPLDLFFVFACAGILIELTVDFLNDLAALEESQQGCQP